MANLISIAGGGTAASTASGARTNLGLGSMAVQDSGSVSISGGTLAGSGAGLTSLTASNLSSGTVPQARKWAETTTTTSSNQDNFDFSGGDLLRCNNSSLLTLRGLLAGVPGQVLTIVAVGSGRVDIANQDTNSTAANRIINGVTATISLVAGLGRAIVQYDGATSRWRVISHEQGAPITPTFSAGDFTANGSMTWTVDSGDVAQYHYQLRGTQLFVSFLIATTSVGGTLNNTLQIAVPAGFAAAEDTRTVGQFNDAGTQGTSRIDVASAGTVIKIIKLPGGTNYSSATNTTAVSGQIIIRVS